MIELKISNLSEEEKNQVIEHLLKLLGMKIRRWNGVVEIFMAQTLPHFIRSRHGRRSIFGEASNKE